MITHGKSDQQEPTNVGKWAAWYRDVEEPWAYGDTTSYAIGAS